jgi:hypothetical protein
MKKFEKCLKASLGSVHMQLTEPMRPSWSSVSSEEITFHHFLLHHLLCSTTFLAFQTQTQIMMMRRRINREMTWDGRRPSLGTLRDRGRDVSVTSSPPLTDKDVPILTPTTMVMLMVVPGLLLEVMVLIGRTCKEMMSEC